MLFWRWDLQVYAGMAPADYGVQVADTTFDLIRDNAAKVKVLSAQQPPDPSCKVGCWVPDIHSGTFSTVNRCARSPSLSLVCYALQYAKFALNLSTKKYPLCTYMRGHRIFQQEPISIALSSARFLNDC